MTTVISGLSTNPNSVEAAKEALDEACSKETEPKELGFVAVFSSPVHDYQAIVDTIRNETEDAALIGASSAGEFTEAGSVNGGVSVTGIAAENMSFYTGLGTGLNKDIEASVSDATSDMPDPSDIDRNAVGVNLHDGLLGRGDEVAMYAYQKLPMAYVGGSAGDDRKLEETAVFVDDDVATDAIGIGMLVSDSQFGTAAAHGHDAISDGLRVTEAEGSTVSELDGKPAFDVWADIVSEHTEVDITELDGSSEELTRLLTIYEFGIQTSDDEYKVRWPGLTNKKAGELEFATNIPEGTELFVLSSDASKQYEAQQSAMREAADSVDDDVAGALSFNCICQADIMGDEFTRGIKEVGKRLGAALGGMQVYGEVNMDKDDMRGYHNATNSVLVIPK